MKKSKVHLREPEGSIAHQIKQIPIDDVWATLKKFEVVDLLKRKPQEHQLRALLLGMLYDSFLFCLDMGLGKTKIAIDIIQCRRHAFRDSGRTLVTCPPVLVRQWGEEIEKDSSLTYTLVQGGRDQKRIQFFTAKTDIVVVSHNWIVSMFRDRRMAVKMNGIAENYDNLIIDESHQIKNHESKGFAGYRKYFSDIPCRYLLTGTPVGNDFTGVFSQYYMVDRGEAFGRNWPPFRMKYFNVHQSKKNPNILYYNLKPEAKKEFTERLWTKAIRWEESEYSDLPEKRYVPMKLEMSSVQWEQYNELLAEERKGKNIDFTQLQSVTGGVNVAKGVNVKMQALYMLLDQIVATEGRRVVVWHWLVEEGRYIESALSKYSRHGVASVRGETASSKTQNILSDFRKGAVKILVANPKSMGIGVNLQEASVCIYWSNSFSMVDRKQSEKRIHRPGQKHTCIYYDLVCEGTIDEIVVRKLGEKGENFENLLRDKKQSWDKIHALSKGDKQSALTF